MKSRVECKFFFIIFNVASVPSPAFPLSIPNSVFFSHLGFRMRIYAQLLYLVLAAATVAGDKSRSSGKEKTIPNSEFLYRYVKKVEG